MFKSNTKLSKMENNELILAFMITMLESQKRIEEERIKAMKRRAGNSTTFIIIEGHEAALSDINHQLSILKSYDLL